MKHNTSKSVENSRVINNSDIKFNSSDVEKHEINKEISPPKNDNDFSIFSEKNKLVNINQNLNSPQKNEKKDEIKYIFRCLESKCNLNPSIFINSQKNTVKLECEPQNEENNEEIDIAKYLKKCCGIFKIIFCSYCDNRYILYSNNDEKNNNDFNYCKKCNDYFCQDCLNQHKELYKDHFTINVNNLNILCANHGLNFVSYCVDCKQNLCSNCIKEEMHKKHNIINLESVKIKDNEFSEIQRKLNKEKIFLTFLEKIFLKSLKHLEKEFYILLNKKISQYKLKEALINEYQRNTMNYNTIMNCLNLKFSDSEISLETRKTDKNYLGLISQIFNILGTKENNNDKKIDISNESEDSHLKENIKEKKEAESSYKMYKTSMEKLKNYREKHLKKKFNNTDLFAIKSNLNNINDEIKKEIIIIKENDFPRNNDIKERESILKTDINEINIENKNQFKTPPINLEYSSLSQSNGNNKKEVIKENLENLNPIKTFRDIDYENKNNNSDDNSDLLFFPNKNYKIPQTPEISYNLNEQNNSKSIEENSEKNNNQKKEFITERYGQKKHSKANDPFSPVLKTENKIKSTKSKIEENLNINQETITDDGLQNKKSLIKPKKINSIKKNIKITKKPNNENNKKDEKNNDLNKHIEINNENKKEIFKNRIYDSKKSIKEKAKISNVISPQKNQNFNSNALDDSNSSSNIKIENYYIETQAPSNSSSVLSNFSSSNEIMKKKRDIKGRIYSLKIYNDPVWCLTSINNNKNICIGLASGLIRIFDQIEFDQKLLINEHKGAIYSMYQIFNNCILTTSTDKLIKKILISKNCEKYEVLSIFKGHKSSVYKAIELNEKLIVSCSDDGTIIIWGAQNNNFKSDKKKILSSSEKRRNYRKTIIKGNKKDDIIPTNSLKPQKSENNIINKNPLKSKTTKKLARNNNSATKSKRRISFDDDNINLDDSKNSQDSIIKKKIISKTIKKNDEISRIIKKLNYGEIVYDLLKVDENTFVSSSLYSYLRFWDITTSKNKYTMKDLNCNDSHNNLCLINKNLIGVLLNKKYGLAVIDCKLKQTIQKIIIDQNLEIKFSSIMLTSNNLIVIGGQNSINEKESQVIHKFFRLKKVHKKVNQSSNMAEIIHKGKNKEDKYIIKYLNGHVKNVPKVLPDDDIWLNAMIEGNDGMLINGFGTTILSNEMGQIDIFFREIKNLDEINENEEKENKEEKNNKEEKKNKVEKKNKDEKKSKIEKKNKKVDKESIVEKKNKEKKENRK